MTILVIFLALAPPVYGSDIPDSFKQEEWTAYERCFRSESNATRDPWPHRAPAKSTLGHFAQVIGYCGPERSRAIEALRKVIQARNPGWTAARVAESAEFVLTGYELQTILDRRGPHCSVHEMPCQEF